MSLRTKLKLKHKKHRNNSLRQSKRQRNTKKNNELQWKSYAAKLEMHHLWRSLHYVSRQNTFRFRDQHSTHHVGISHGFKVIMLQKKTVKMCNLCLILTAVIISAQLVVILTSLQHSFGLRSHRRKKKPTRASDSNVKGTVKTVLPCRQ